MENFETRSLSVGSYNRRSKGRHWARVFYIQVLYMYEYIVQLYNVHILYLYNIYAGLGVNGNYFLVPVGVIIAHYMRLDLRGIPVSSEDSNPFPAIRTGALEV